MADDKLEQMIQKDKLLQRWKSQRARMSEEYQQLEQRAIFASGEERLNLRRRVDTKERKMDELDREIRLQIDKLQQRYVRRSVRDMERQKRDEQIQARKAAEQRQIEYKTFIAKHKNASSEIPLFEEFAMDPNFRKEFEKNRGATTAQARRAAKLYQRDTDRWMSDKVGTRARATIGGILEESFYGMFGAEGQARMAARRAPTKELAKQIRRESRYRYWANTLEDNFGVIGGAYAQRLRNKIDTVRSDEPGSPFTQLSAQELAQDLKAIMSTVAQQENRLTELASKVDRIDTTSPGNIGHNSGDKVDSDIDTPAEFESQIENNTKDINVLNTKVTNLTSEFNKLKENQSRFIKSMAEIEELKKRYKKPEDESKDNSAANWLGAMGLGAVLKGGARKVARGVSAMSRYSKFMKFGGRALGPLGVMLGAYEGLNVIGEANKARDEALGITPDMPQEEIEKRRREYHNARKRKGYDDLREETRKLKEQYGGEIYGPPVPKDLDGPGPTSQIGEVKKAGFSLPGLSGFWDHFSGAATRRKLQDMKMQSISKSPFNIQTIDDRIYRNQIEMDKSQFMQFGALPRGFEFIPGHNGRLGQSNAIMAGGGMPLGEHGGMYPGGLGTADAPYSSGGGGSGNPELARLATSEDAKKVIADAVQGNIPLTSAIVDRAMKMQGLHESGDRQILMQYLKQGGKGIDPAATPWCAAFVNASLAGAGYYGTGSFVANSFQNWGELKQQSEVQKGDVLVQSRGLGPGQAGGHVGMATGEVKKDKQGRVTHIEMLGGNQSNKVTRQWVRADALQVRRASEREMSPEAKEAMTKITGKPYGAQTAGVVPVPGTAATVTPGTTNTNEDFGNLNSVDPNALKFIRSIGARETNFRKSEADSEQYNQAGNNSNVRKYGAVGADYGFFQTNQMDVQDAIRRGVPEHIAKALNNGDGKGGYTVEQQTYAMNEYLKKLNPAGYDAMVRGDWDSANKAFKGKWPSLPGGLSYRPSNDAAANAALSGRILPGMVSGEYRPGTARTTVAAPKLSGVPYMPVQLKPEIDPKSAFKGDSVLPSLQMPQQAPDMSDIADPKQTEIDQKAAISDAVGTNYGATVPTDDMRPESTPAPPPIPNEMESTNQAFNDNTRDEINKAAPDLNYGERTGTSQPKPDNAANSNQGGGGARNNPETQGPKPGSGGYGAHGRCFI